MGMEGMPLGMPMGTMPMPAVPSFDPTSATPDADPVGSKVNAVAVLVARQNPEMDPTTVRRIARKVVGRLVEADWGWSPHQQGIEDPLANKPPFSIPGGEKDQQEGEGDDKEPKSSFPTMPKIPGMGGGEGGGAAAGGEAAGAEGAGAIASEALPLLLV